jgi:NAD(P)-dependent dehydrogenase (short-subunit alcohol dehydrogenase family)
MKDKIVLITGATSGIGKVAAITLAKMGAQVVLHGRNTNKAEAVRQEIMAACGHRKVDILIADLFSLAETRKMAEVFNSRYQHLDVLINNAGALMGNHREVTTEGIEKTMAINLFAPFLLTGLLFHQLMKSPAGRIINLSSSAHRQNARPDFTDIQGLQNYSPL